MAYVCGTEGFVEVGVDRLDVTNWSATETAEWEETTNTASAGYKESIHCKKSMTGSVNANYDPLLGPKNAPDFEAGDQVAMELHTGADGNYTLTANILTLEWTNPAAGAVTYSFTFESNGAYAHA